MYIGWMFPLLSVYFKHNLISTAIFWFSCTVRDTSVVHQSICLNVRSNCLLDELTTESVFQAYKQRVGRYKNIAFALPGDRLYILVQ